MPALRRTLFAVLCALTAFTSSGAGPAVAQQATAPSSFPPETAQLLADLLNDEATRNALITQLKAIGGGRASEKAGPAGAQTAAEADPILGKSIGLRIAETTKALAEGLSDTAETAFANVGNGPGIFESLSGDEITILMDALQSLIAVILISFGVLVFLRFWAKRLYRSLGGSTQEAGIAKTTIMLLVITMIDTGVVIVSWAAGYTESLLWLGAMGEVGIYHSLYLNAFLAIELTRVAFRIVLSPSTSDLRFLSISDSAARLMSRTFGVMAMVVGYGQLLLVPIINQEVSHAAGRGTSALTALVAIAIAVGLVLFSRRRAAMWLIGGNTKGKRGLRKWLARNWHVPVILYLAFLLALVLAWPDGLIWPVLFGTAKVLLAVVVGAVVAGALKRSVLHGVSLPASVNYGLPLLERRLNTFVPRLLFLVRMTIMAAVIAFSLATLGVVDVAGWFESQMGIRLTGMFLSVVLIILMSFAVWLALSSWIDYRLNPQVGTTATAREKTLLSLLRNAATISLVVMTLMFVLSEVGIDIAPLIASAGVIGLAIGFGAQKMVQDIITGVFIQFENAMNVGDEVTLSNITGIVERLTIRSVSLRDIQGVFHIIPFSSVDMVSNYMRDYSFFVCDMSVAYREDVTVVKQAMHDAYDEMARDEKWARYVLETLEWMGLHSLADSAVILRARIKCTPGDQWAVGRQYNEICKRIFDERGIEIPFPHQTIYFGEDRSGKAPAAAVRIEREVGA